MVLRLTSRVTTLLTILRSGVEIWTLVAEASRCRLFRLNPSIRKSLFFLIIRLSVWPIRLVLSRRLATATAWEITLFRFAGLGRMGLPMCRARYPVVLFVPRNLARGALMILKFVVVSRVPRLLSVRPTTIARLTPMVP